MIFCLELIDPRISKTQVLLKSVNFEFQQHPPSFPNNPYISHFRYIAGSAQQLYHSHYNLRLMQPTNQSL